MLDSMIKAWKENGIMDSISGVKKVFIEKKGDGFIKIFDDYSSFIKRYSDRLID